MVKGGDCRWLFRGWYGLVDGWRWVLLGGGCLMADSGVPWESVGVWSSWGWVHTGHSRGARRAIKT